LVEMGGAHWAVSVASWITVHQLSRFKRM